MNRYRAEIPWIAALLALPLLGALRFPGISQRQNDTWSVNREGKKVFFTLLQRLAEDVRRSTERLDPPADAGMLVVLGSARAPTAAEWRRLHAWVAQGHTLVFAAPPSGSPVELPPFRLRIRSRESSRADKTRTLELDPSLADAIGPGSASIEWTDEASIEGARPDAWIAARVGGEPVIVAQREGKGLVVVAASDLPFDNAWLAEADHVLLPFRLLERAHQTAGAIVFDESLNTSGPRVIGLLLGPALRPLMLQVLALAFIVGWMGARTFGAPTTRERATRRLMAEHAHALGTLCHRARAGSMLVASYLEYFCREMGLVHRTKRDPAATHRLGGKMRADAAAVGKALRDAEGTVAAGACANHQAAAMIAALSSVKARVAQRASKGM
jgi:hypothetical protein